MWKAIEPAYLQKTTELVNNFENSRDKSLGSADLVQIAKAIMSNKNRYCIVRIRIKGLAENEEEKIKK